MRREHKYKIHAQKSKDHKMLADSQDEADGKHHSHSPLLTLRRKVGNMFSRSHKEENRDSALSTSSEESDLQTPVAADLTTMSCRQTAKGDQFSNCVHMQRESLTFTSQYVQDHNKAPASKTIVHIKAKCCLQCDGLLQVTDQCIGKDSDGNPVYKVNCRGNVGETNTNLVWYIMYNMQDCKRIFLHALPPDFTATEEDIPLEQYSHRLFRYKYGEHYVLAAHKVAQVIPKFDDDNDAFIDVCYHESKGGMVTLQENSSSHGYMEGMLVGAKSDGEMELFHKSQYQGYCTNPFTLFYVYDEMGAKPAEDSTRMYGEL